MLFTNAFNCLSSHLFMLVLWLFFLTEGLFLNDCQYVSLEQTIYSYFQFSVFNLSFEIVLGLEKFSYRVTSLSFSSQTL